MSAIVYLETSAQGGEFNARGEVGPGDNPDAYARLMAGHGLRVVVTDGSELDAPEGTPVAVGELQFEALGPLRSGNQDIRQRLRLVGLGG